MRTPKRVIVYVPWYCQMAREGAPAERQAQRAPLKQICQTMADAVAQNITSSAAANAVMTWASQLPLPPLPGAAASESTTCSAASREYDVLIIAGDGSEW